MKSNNESQNFGVKLTNELMTDILGAIIPGALFIVSLSISVIIPMSVIFNRIGALNYQEIPDGTPWVLLILCLILSYVFGLIFYRADIKAPDQDDIERQIIGTILENYKKEKLTLIRMFQNTAKALYENSEQAITKCEKDSLVYKTLETLKEACSKFNNENPCHTDFLKILFPEDFVNDNDGPLSDYSIEVLTYYKELFINARSIYDRYNNYPLLTFVYRFIDRAKVNEFLKNRKCADKLQAESLKGILKNFDFNNIDRGNANLDQILVCIYYSILNTQCELGCCAKIRGEFPYMNYYKYLLNRNLHECVKLVSWCSRKSRTKNQLNHYKIDIQTFASEAYALLNKNESHIRMSSASYHVAYRIKVISFCMIVLIPVFLFALFLIERPAVNVCCHYSTIKSLWILILFPLSIALLSALIRRRIIKYIHYQRLREIYYTLFVYKEYEGIIEKRKSILAESSYYIDK